MNTIIFKFKKIFRIFKSISSWIIYIILLIIFIDFSAGFALNVYKYHQRGATEFDRVNPEVMKELKEIQSNKQLNLYRWYNNLPNFRGNHVITDRSGFRINPDTIGNEDIIGMFGGSTTLSSITDQSGTIPNLLSELIPDHQVLNFGVGGYSTGSEIMTLVEALRTYPKMKIAIFYDGVNELGRAVESNGDYKQSPISYDLIGVPYLDGKLIALRSYVKGISILDSNLYYIYQVLSSRFKLNNDISSQKKMLSQIVNRYYENIKVINGICKGYEIKCLFVWQPSVYTLADNSLHEREKKIRKDTPRSNYTKLTSMIFTDWRSKHYNITDLTNSLDTKLPTDQFYNDWCHLTREGNLLVAKALAKKFEF